MSDGAQRVVRYSARLIVAATILAGVTSCSEPRINNTRLGSADLIVMTDRKIPFSGTFTCRILFYGDEYAGTWRGANHGGHMWGRIERPEDEAPEEAPEKAEEKKTEETSGDDDDKIAPGSSVR